MNVSSKIRQRAFEAAVLLTIVVLPGAAILLARMDSELAQSRQQLAELSRSQAEYFIGEYLDVGGQIEANLNKLQDSLRKMIQNRSYSSLAFEHSESTAAATNWLKLQMNRPKWERIQNPKLMEEIARQQPAFPINGTTISADLTSLLEDVRRRFDDYIGAAKTALDNAGTSTQKGERVIPEEVLGAVSDPARQLKALAADARRSAAAIDEFLKNQNPPSPPSSTVRYLLLAGLAVIFVLMILMFRCFVTRELHLDLTRKNIELEHQHQLSHFGQMAASLAHEIRNPLTAISARLYTLQKGIQEGSPEYQDSIVIRDEIRRLDRIVQDFVKLARPAPPRLMPMSAEPFLKNLSDFLAPQYESHSIQLQVDSTTPDRFQADEAQLKQVLINLVRNAAESMEKGGKITLRARSRYARLRGRDREVVIIEVEDTGPGIAPDVQERLFTPFFSTKEGGTGLGLAISSQIVNRHDGELTFETHLHRGTTFSVVLPLYEKSSDATRNDTGH